NRVSDTRKSPFPGNVFFRARDKGPKFGPRASCGVSETKRLHRTPPIRGFSRGFRKSPQNLDCLVADAVDIEPVSSPDFPVEQGNNRESHRYHRLQSDSCAELAN